MLRSYFYPSKINTRLEEIPLKNLKSFPLLAKLCVRPGFDISALRRAGYYNTNHFFAGKSKFEKDHFVGWAGHTESGEVVSSVEELLKGLTRKSSLENYLARINVTTLSGEKIPMYIDDLSKTELINYPDNCQTLDLTKNSKTKDEGVKEIELKFHPPPTNVTIYVILLGKTSSCSRNLAELAFSQQGDRVELGRNWEKNFYVKIIGNKFPEEDPKNECREYPNNDYFSYKDCDDAFLKREVDLLSPGLRPIWITKDLDTVTIKRKLQHSFGKVSLLICCILILIHAPFHISGYHDKMKSLYTGKRLSDCPMPCTTFGTSTKMISKRATVDKSHIVLSFSGTVQMTITEMETPSISGLLSAVGGSIGLWLGIGVLQAIELLTSLFLALFDRVRKG